MVNKKILFIMDIIVINVNKILFVDVDIIVSSVRIMIFVANVSEILIININLTSSKHHNIETPSILSIYPNRILSQLSWERLLNDYEQKLITKFELIQ